jgi:hypothetical protein
MLADVTASALFEPSADSIVLTDAHPSTILAPAALPAVLAFSFLLGRIHPQVGSERVRFQPLPQESKNYRVSVDIFQRSFSRVLRKQSLLKAVRDQRPYHPNTIYVWKASGPSLCVCATLGALKWYAPFPHSIYTCSCTASALLLDSFTASGALLCPEPRLLPVQQAVAV